MRKNPFVFFIPALLAAVFFAAPAAGRDEPANALLVVPSGNTAYDNKFQDFMDKHGAKLLEYYQPNVFVGYIPQALDSDLGTLFNAQVYRGKVEDWSSFARYGDRAVYAVNNWNKRFVEDPPEAPLVVSSMVQRAGKKGDSLNFTWNAVMKATSYRLEISSCQDFSEPQLDTVLAGNSYRLVPAFWADGVYYWRVAGLLRLNTGQLREGAFSAVYTFAVSNSGAAAAAKLQAPPLPPKTTVKGRPLSWASPVAFKYYRLQIADSNDFTAPLVDVFTDTCTYRLSGLGLNIWTPYFMRVKGSDGAAAGDWSEVSALMLEPAEHAPGAGKP